MNRTVQTVSALLILAVAALTGFFLQQSLNDTGAVTDTTVQVLGQPRPDFSLPDLELRLRTMSEWDGKLIVLNFWATWCPPCREEIPVFISLQEEYAEQGLQFIGIALQDADEVREYVREMGMNYPVLTGYREVIALAEALGNTLGALPYTVIIDRDGTVTFTRAGPLDEAAARAAIAAYL
ncbi:MAG: TlpA family protein disulfide reductase [Thiotrichales bacterium]|nr:TlpA family protein disulfide reductase [Thiotrichales bacterium]